MLPWDPLWRLRHVGYPVSPRGYRGLPAFASLSMAGSARTEQIFCITDLTPEQADPGQLLALNRGHWSIENRLHWVRDVTFDEDRCQIRKGHGPQVLACLRNAVIGLLRRLIRQPRQSIASMIRHFAAHPALALAVFLR